ncbi:MAG: potassium channel family protein [Alistipes sp.]|nr:potassium channel family protein [Alistipes sp.]MDE7129271.1 potassium channel family protein [Alistipes sp.]
MIASNRLNTLTLLASIALIVALSMEIIPSKEYVVFSSGYLTTTLIVCLIYMADFFVRMSAANYPLRYFWRNIVVLLLSIPYQNILYWTTGGHVSHDVSLILSGVILLRAFLALYMIVRWLVGGSINRLFTAYIITLVVFTYISALIFYEYEAPVNTHLHGFGNALWWAWMNVTTVGAAIFPVTAIGKVVCVLLPMLGMAMFPIFTVYVTNLYNAGLTKRKEQSPQ